MLYFIMNTPIGIAGLIGYYFKDIGIIPSLLMLFAYIAVPYALGSINTAIIVSKKMYNDDIRNYGSGNAGFTNMMRVYGGRAAVITFVGDMAKTMVAIIFGWCFLGFLSAYIAALACFVGHIYPVFYNFKGGKGVVCLATTIFMLDWRIFLILFVIFVLTVYMTRYISFGAVLCSMLYPLFMTRLYGEVGIMGLVSVAMAALIVFKHRSNIKRIFEGTESKFEFKRSKKKSADSGDGDAK